ncbi:facilitated trehalose transporter Tret1-2 homolog [Plodia interpunctella]|uniref:facilitated trehalose transporter Tret1-2 homolog n=1 Tax=Plodia interpunctella TaxID=58824 RepID=UPI002368A685|nr:facilitated trehalose transporter Tret1-2 homolog [Plodia interpunctella]
METFSADHTKSHNHEQVLCDYEHTSWKPFLRQIVITTAMWTCYFTYGLFVGTPTVLVAYVRREANSTDAVSKEMASWLSSAFGYSATPWVVILPIVMHFYGSKKPFIFITLSSILSIIVFVTSQSMEQVIISETLLGPLIASNVTLSSLVLTEYTSPKYRGLFLTLKSASFFWGIWVANAVGTFFHWKNMAIIGILCMAYNLVTVYFWCESPYWLARQGRFAECTDVIYWLKGNNVQSQEELKHLIRKYKDRLRVSSERQNQVKRYILSTHKTLFCKEIYKPLLISLLVMELYYICGKFICSVYAIDIFKRISGEDAAYRNMLILDGVTVLSMYIGCYLTKISKRRILLFASTSCGIFFLFIMIIYLYLIKLDIILENSYVSLALLSAYSLSVCCGPIIMATSIAAELIPLKVRGTSLCINAFCSKITVSTFLKLSPYMFESWGMHGTFLFYAIGTLIVLVLLYVYLPETKDKTLQEIVDSMNPLKSGDNVEMKELVDMKN